MKDISVKHSQKTETVDFGPISRDVILNKKIEDETLRATNRENELEAQITEAGAPVKDVKYNGTSIVVDKVAEIKPSIEASVAVETARATTAEGTLQTNLEIEVNARINAITAEATTRATEDTKLSDRIDSLESRGRFLSTWNATTGLPSTYPPIPETETGLTYTYNFRAGDYYIIHNVGTSNKKPTGSSIQATRTEIGQPWSWTIGSAEETESVSNNGTYTYDGTNWVLMGAGAAAAWGSIGGNIADQTDLSNALNAKANDNNVVHKSGDETITGTKTFNNTLVVANGISSGLSVVNNGWTTTLTQNGGVSVKFAGDALECVNNKNLGAPSAKWKDIYASGNISNGTKTIPIANIAAPINNGADGDVLTKHIQTQSTPVIGATDTCDMYFNADTNGEDIQRTLDKFDFTGGSVIDLSSQGLGKLISLFATNDQSPLLLGVNVFEEIEKAFNAIYPQETTTHTKAIGVFYYNPSNPELTTIIIGIPSDIPLPAFSTTLTAGWWRFTASQGWEHIIDINNLKEKYNLYPVSTSGFGAGKATCAGITVGLQNDKAVDLVSKVADLFGNAVNEEKWQPLNIPVKKLSSTDINIWELDDGIYQLTSSEQKELHPASGLTFWIENIQNPILEVSTNTTTNKKPFKVYQDFNALCVGEADESDGYANHILLPATRGTSGQVLTSNGSGAAPTWQTPTAPVPSNMVTTDSAQTISGAKTFSSTTYFGSGINQYIVGNAGYSQLYIGSWGGHITLEANDVSPDSDNIRTLGRSGRIWNTTYTTSISDGTNSISVANICNKSTVSVSDTGTATDEVGYITIDGVEKKLAGGGTPSNMVTTDTAQLITGIKTMRNNFRIGSQTYYTDFTYDSSSYRFDIEQKYSSSSVDKPTIQLKNTSVVYPSVTNTCNLGRPSLRWNTIYTTDINASGNISDGTNSTTVANIAVKSTESTETTGQLKIAVVTALPENPDANTLYFIREA